MDDVRLQDLRYSFGGVGVGSGESLPVVGALMGHRTAVSSARLASLAPGPVKAAAERISGEVARLMGLEIVESPLAETAHGWPHAKTAVAAVAERRWIGVHEAARRTGLSRSALQHYRSRGMGPSFRKLRYIVVYPEDELAAWCAARRARAGLGPLPGRPPKSAPQKRQANAQRP